MSDCKNNPDLLTNCIWYSNNTTDNTTLLNLVDPASNGVVVNATKTGTDRFGNSNYAMVYDTLGNYSTTSAYPGTLTSGTFAMWIYNTAELDDTPRYIGSSVTAIPFTKASIYDTYSGSSSEGAASHIDGNGPQWVVVQANILSSCIFFRNIDAFTIGFCVSSNSGYSGIVGWNKELMAPNSGWHFIVGTWGPATCFYFDGILKTKVDYLLGVPIGRRYPNYLMYPLDLGGVNEANNNDVHNWPSIIGESFVYSTALSPSKVLELYNFTKDQYICKPYTPCPTLSFDVTQSSPYIPLYIRCRNLNVEEGDTYKWYIKRHGEDDWTYFSSDNYALYNIEDSGNYDIKLYGESSDCATYSVEEYAVSALDPCPTLDFDSNYVPDAPNIAPTTVIFYPEVSDMTNPNNYEYNWDFGDGSYLSSDLVSMQEWTNNYVYKYGGTEKPATTYDSTISSNVLVTNSVFVYTSAPGISTITNDTVTLIVKMKCGSTGKIPLYKYVKKTDYADGIYDIWEDSIQVEDNDYHTYYITIELIGATMVGFALGIQSVYVQYAYVNSYTFVMNPSHTYVSAGKYTVSLTYNNGNCLKTITKADYITINGSKPEADFEGNPLTGYKSATVTFTNKSTSASTYLWSFGDGYTSTETNPTHTYSSTGSYSVTLIAKLGNDVSVKRKEDYITVYGDKMYSLLGEKFI